MIMDKYDEAIEKLREVAYSPDGVTLRDLERIFPELKDKESEDERIRKELIEYFDWNVPQFLNNFSNREVVAWLKKQGEQKPASKIEPKFKVHDVIIKKHNSDINKFGRFPITCITGGKYWYNNHVICDISEQDEWELVEQKPAKYTLEQAAGIFLDALSETPYNNKPVTDAQIITKELLKFMADTTSYNPNAINEQKPADEITIALNPYAYRIGFADGEARAKKELKPAEWSEEDEAVLDTLIRKIEGEDVHVSPHIALKTLKSLKNQVTPQPKQEWSEEDIEMIEWLIRCCEKEHEELCNDKYGHQEIVSDLKRDCRKKWDWLESLKNKVVPQKQWKPSEEQMEVLNEVINYAADHATIHWNDYVYNILKALREQLKNL